MAYTGVNKSSSYFNTKLYTGDASSSNAITGVGFQPEWTWIKGRNIAESHRLYDAVRGASNYVTSNSTGAQSSSIPLTSFNADGFTIGTNDDSVNGSYNYTSWNWKANGLGSSNSDGTINTTYTSASTTSGFSICQYTGTGANATIGHGLGVAPKMIIVKQTNTTKDWAVYHKFSNPDGTGAQYYLHLNTADQRTSNSGFWNNTDPTSSVFSVGSNSNTNQSGGTYIAYCFADIQGFSKASSYIGNGSTNGPFVYTGFKPAWIMVKETGTGNWIIKDSKTPAYNQNDNFIKPNSSDAESTNAILGMDLLSNGFKVRASAGDMNGDGTEIFYMAFAEAPLVGSNNVPANAR